MRRQLSLSFLTCLGAAPEESVRAAATAGYDYIGLRMLPAAPGGIAFPLMDDPRRAKDLRSLIADLGIGVFDVEMIRIAPGFNAEPFLPFLECSAEMGARAILVAGDDPDESRLTASFARLCETAAPFGLSMDLEFMPQSELHDLSAALRVLQGAAQPNQGIIVDALHVSRSRTPIDQLSEIPRAWLNYAQICDGPADIPQTRDGLNYAARHERLMPGEGAIDLRGIFSNLPGDLPIAVEIPNDKQSAGLTAAAWAAMAKRASLSVLDAGAPA